MDEQQESLRRDLANQHETFQKRQGDERASLLNKLQSEALTAADTAAIAVRVASDKADECAAPFCCFTWSRWAIIGGVCSALIAVPALIIAGVAFQNS